MQAIRHTKMRDQVLGHIKQYIVDSKTGVELHQRLVDQLAAGRVGVASAELHEHIQGNKERL